MTFMPSRCREPAGLKKRAEAAKPDGLQADARRGATRMMALDILE